MLLSRNAIVSILNARFGNNLFQIAAGRTLARKLGVPHYLDVFNVPYGESLRALRESYLGRWGLGPPRHLWLADRVFRKTIRRTLRSLVPRHYIEPGFRTPVPDIDQVNEEFRQLGPGTIVTGWFQNPAFFAGNEDDIRQLFDPRRLVPKPRRTAMAAAIEDSKAVGVHVRRGDYLTTAGYAVCTADYYREGMAWFRQHRPGVRFFIFSDDPAWAGEALAADDVTVASVDDDTEASAYEDFTLLARCRHQVISNSSFSWWASWLNDNPDKTVLAPSLWQGERGSTIETKRFAGLLTLEETRSGKPVS